MRAILTLLLLLSAASASAEWIESGESTSAISYVDPDTMERIGHVRRFWAIQEMKETTPSGVMSIRALEEYDCAGAKFRYLSISAHSGPMAGGQILLADSLNDDWSYIPPGRSPSALQRIVCAP